VIFSCDFELDPARMDLLNLSDRIFGEFVHGQIWIADAGIAGKAARTRLTAADKERGSVWFLSMSMDHGVW